MLILKQGTYLNNLNEIMTCCDCGILIIIVLMKNKTMLMFDK